MIVYLVTTFDKYTIITKDYKEYSSTQLSLGYNHYRLIFHRWILFLKIADLVLFVNSSWISPSKSAFEIFICQLYIPTTGNTITINNIIIWQWQLIAECITERKCRGILFWLIVSYKILYVDFFLNTEKITLFE